MLRKWTTPVVLVALIVILVVGAWWGWKALTRPLDANPPKPCVTQSVGATLKSNQVSVQVLNGGSVSGLAGKVSDYLKQKGFVITRAGNTNDAVTATTIVGHAADDPEVKLVAGFFPNAQIKADGRTDHVVDVLLADQFDGFNDAAPTEIEVPSGEVCLPGPSSGAKPSASAS